MTSRRLSGLARLSSIVTPSFLSLLAIGPVEATVELLDDGPHSLLMLPHRLLYRIRAVPNAGQHPPGEEQQNAKLLQVTIIESWVARPRTTSGAAVLNCQTVLMGGT